MAGVKPGAVIFAKDIDKLAAFYAGLLGMTIMETERDAIRLEDASLGLVIHALPRAVAKAIIMADPPAPRTQNAIKPVFIVDDLVGARAAAAQLGGALKPARAEFVWKGFRACDGHDPEGNVFQLRVAVD